MKNIQKLEDGTYHPHDLMAHKIQIDMEEQNRKALNFFLDNDDKLEMLFKHYETIQSYHHAFDELIRKATDYRKQEENEAHWVLSADEINNMQKQLDEIHTKTADFILQFRNVQKTVMFTFEA